MKKLKNISKEIIAPANIFFLLLFIFSFILEYLNNDQIIFGAFSIHLFYFYGLNLLAAFFLRSLPFIGTTLVLALLESLFYFKNDFVSKTYLFAAFLALTTIFYLFLNLCRKTTIYKRAPVFTELLTLLTSYFLYHLVYHLISRDLSKGIYFEMLYSSVFASFFIYFLVLFGRLFSEREHMIGNNLIFKILMIPFFIFLITIILEVFVIHGYLTFQFANLERGIKEEFVKEVHSVLAFKKRYYEEELGKLKNTLSILSNLPGIQWRRGEILKLAQQRLNEFFLTSIEKGVDSYFVVSEGGKVELFAGVRPDKNIVKILVNKVGFYPEHYHNEAKKFFYFGPVNQKIYIIYPVYKLALNPETKEKPDLKRNGFIGLILDLDIFFRQVQKDFPGENIEVVLYQENNKLKSVSYLLELFAEKEDKEELTKLINSFLKEQKKNLSYKYAGSYLLMKTQLFKQPFSYLVIVRDLSKVSKAYEVPRNTLLKGMVTISIFVFGLAVAVYVFLALTARFLQVELRKKEEELKEEISEKYRFLETILEDLPVGFILVNKNGDIKYINAYGKFFIEREKGGLVQNLQESSFGVILDALKSKDIVVRKEVVVKDRIYGVSSKALTFKGEELASILINDITEVRKIQQTALEESRSLIIGELSRNFVEAISNPLQHALAKLSAILIDKKIPSDKLQILKSIGEHLEEAVEETYRFMAFSAETWEKKEAEFKLSELIERINMFTRASFDRYGIKFVTNISGDYKLKGLFSRIELVFVSLFSFIVEQLKTFEGEKKISLNAYANEEMLRVEIWFTGPALSPEEIEMILKPYYTEAFSGKLLTVFLAKELAEKDNGLLSYEVRGEENIFILEYPLA